jgi:hypothetical protein
VLPPGAREEGHRLDRAAAVREARASEWPDREGRRTLDKMIGVARPESSKGPKAARSRAKAGNARTRIRWLDSVFARCSALSFLSFFGRFAGRPVSSCDSFLGQCLKERVEVGAQDQRAHLCRDRRLHLDLCRHLRDHEHEELPVKRLCHSVDPHRREDGIHKRRPAWALSRRRAT